MSLASLALKLIRLKKKIEAEYGELLTKINEYEQELNDLLMKYESKVQELIDNPREKLPTRINNSMEGILRKINKLKKSIADLQKTAEEKYQKALQSVNDYVNKQIEIQTKNILKEEEEKELAKKIV